jgi:hypothetical protein
MITNLNTWKKKINESVNTVDKSKFEELIKLGRSMLNDHKKLAEIKALKKVENKKVKNLLELIDKTSVIANDTLIEVFKPYKSKRFNSKEYFEFVENSIGVIGKDFKELSDTIKAASTKITTATVTIRKNKNTKGKETGTLKMNENKLMDLLKSVVNWFSKQIKKIINKINKDLASINKKAEKFNKMALNESSENNDDSELTPREKRNKYSREYKLKKRAPIQVLKRAKKAIKLAEQEKYYTDLVESKEERIKELLIEFDAKSVAIDDKILTLVNTPEKTTVDVETYKKQMLNAEIVGGSVAKMTQALIAIHEKYFEVSGSVRHFHNNSDEEDNLGDGSFDGRFDWEQKKVVRKDKDANESFVSNIKSFFKKVGRFIMSFKKASKEFDKALNSI